MIPLGVFGGYQETTRESVVTSDSVGQSGGEEAEQEMEEQGVEGNKLIEHSKGIIMRDHFSLCTHCSVIQFVHLIMDHLHASTANTLCV